MKRRWTQSASIKKSKLTSAIKKESKTKEISDTDSIDDLFNNLPPLPINNVLQCETKSIDKIFSPDYFLSMSDYQRPVSTL